MINRVPHTLPQCTTLLHHVKWEHSILVNRFTTVRTYNGEYVPKGIGTLSNIELELSPKKLGIIVGNQIALIPEEYKIGPKSFKTYSSEDYKE
jgi:hypothetical protein